MTLNNNESDQCGEDVLDDSMMMDKSESLHDIPMPSTDNNTNDETKLPMSEAETSTTTPATTEEAPTTEEIPELESPDLEVGDHVYQWRSLLGVPYMFQHHGIIMDVIKDEEGKPVRLTIADFSNVETKGAKKNAMKNITSGSKNNSTDNLKESTQNAPAVFVEETIENTETNSSNTTTKQKRTPMFSSRQISLEQEGVVNTYTDTDKWHKVHYQYGWWKRQFRRSGTVTKAKSDPVGLVLARVSFIMQHPEQLPDYHVLHANCECVAFWCKTGEWSTLQASSFLELTAAGQAKSTATLAATAAGTTATVTAPAAGIWGSWFGFTTTSSVSWLSLHPMAMPGLACYAAITVGVPAVMYATAHKQWKETSQRLSDAFWDSATENPDVFAECLTHWSEKG